MNVGILGGGQLGWMTILEGRKLGYKFFVLDKNPEAPASKIADVWFPPEEVEEFYSVCDVITYEFEHIEEEVLEKVEDKVIPDPKALRLKKSRGEEKEFLYRHGYPLPRFRRGRMEDLKRLIDEIGAPAVVKSERLGYDGKGQYRVSSGEDLEEIYRNHSPDESFVVEEFVDFEREVSAVGVRDRRGRIKIYPITENFHEEGILLYNRTTERFPSEKEVLEIVSSLMEDLSIVGLLAVEFFVTEDRILINEFAPRPHNTGHYTLDGAYTSQFENFLRAITDLPLGSTRLKLPSGMVNILGLSYNELSIPEILSVEGSKLYWYGKEKRERRKMGHVNLVAKDSKGVKDRIEQVLKLLYRRDYALT